MKEHFDAATSEFPSVLNAILEVSEARKRSSAKVAMTNQRALLSKKLARKDSSVGSSTRHHLGGGGIGGLGMGLRSGSKIGEDVSFNSMLQNAKSGDSGKKRRAPSDAPQQRGRFYARTSSALAKTASSGSVELPLNHSGVISTTMPGSPDATSPRTAPGFSPPCSCAGSPSTDTTSSQQQVAALQAALDAQQQQLKMQAAAMAMVEKKQDELLSMLRTIMSSFSPPHDDAAPPPSATDGSATSP